MRDGWTETTLNTVLLPVLTRAKDNSEYEVLSVTERRGIIPQTEVFNHRIATDDISKYKVLQPGDIAFNPYLLWCGAVGQWKGNYEGVVSPVYECFRVRETDSPRFIGLIFESGVLTPYFDSTAIGSIVRRRRTTLPVFYEAPIFRPPLAEQKRIVDIVSCVDAYIDALQQQADTARTVRNAVLHELLSAGGDDWTETTLNAISQNLNSRRIPITKSDRKSGNVPYYGASGIVDYVDGFIFDERALLISEDGANLIARSTPIAFSAEGRYWVNNHAHVLKFDEPSTHMYVEYYLNLIQINVWVTGAAQPKLNQKSLNEIPIPLPPLNEQKRIVEIVSSLDEMIQSTEQAVVDAKNLRSGLLSDLLSGEHEIPELYDRLLGAA